MLGQIAGLQGAVSTAVLGMCTKRSLPRAGTKSQHKVCKKDLFSGNLVPAKLKHLANCTEFSKVHKPADETFLVKVYSNLHCSLSPLQISKLEEEAIRHLIADARVAAEW